MPCCASAGIFRCIMVILNCGLRPRTRRWGLCLLLLAFLVAGCAHSGRRGGRAGAVMEVPVPQPPVFLDGPMALLLTNVDGFRAHAVLESGAAATRVEPVAGELLGQGGKLVFAPGPSRSGGKRSHTAGSAFLWDVAASRGYLLNDPLQAYAPIAASREFTNFTVGGTISGSAPEKVAGHPCQPAEVTVAGSDGSATVCRLWRATDLKGLPVRITCAWNGRPFTLTLSKARLESMPEDLFLPPRDFTKYNTCRGFDQRTGGQATESEAAPHLRAGPERTAHNPGEPHAYPRVKAPRGQARRQSALRGKARTMRNDTWPRRKPLSYR